MKSINNLPTLPIGIPEMSTARYSHHPISRGQDPDFYKPGDLRDSALAKTAWVDFFEKMLAAIYWKIQKPVPYAFRTYNGTIRSLDAGCLKFLANRQPPEIAFVTDSDGYIDAVEPSAKLLQRYELTKELLLQRINPPLE
jgi:hypothetical protein